MEQIERQQFGHWTVRDYVLSRLSDDYTTDLAGDAGSRIACGVISAN